jgi:hypothetical protein
MNECEDENEKENNFDFDFGYELEFGGNEKNDNRNHTHLAENSTQNSICNVNSEACESEVVDGVEDEEDIEEMFDKEMERDLLESEGNEHYDNFVVGTFLRKKNGRKMTRFDVGWGVIHLSGQDYIFRECHVVCWKK